MSVAVSAADIYIVPKIIDAPHRISIQKEYGLDVPFEFHACIDGTGDASAGHVDGTFDFGTFLAGKPLYVTITSIHIYTSSSLITRISCATNEWENSHIEGVDHNFYLFSCPAATSTPNFSETLKETTIYMGKPRYSDSNAGNIFVYWGTNNDAENYKCHIFGYVTTHPRILVPFQSGLALPNR